MIVIWLMWIINLAWFIKACIQRWWQIVVIAFHNLSWRLWLQLLRRSILHWRCWRKPWSSFLLLLLMMMSNFLFKVKLLGTINWRIWHCKLGALATTFILMWLIWHITSFVLITWLLDFKFNFRITLFHISSTGIWALSLSIALLRHLTVMILFIILRVRFGKIQRPLIKLWPTSQFIFISNAYAIVIRLNLIRLASRSSIRWFLSLTIINIFLTIQWWIVVSVNIQPTTSLSSVLLICQNLNFLIETLFSILEF